MTTEEEIVSIKEAMVQLSAEMRTHQQQLLQLQQRLAILESQLPGTVKTQTGKVPQALSQKKTSWQGNAGLENFIGLRLIHLVGIVVLVIGISMGVKYAIDKELISETARITLAALAGTILFVLSIRLKKKYNFFSAILYSGAMATFYFTVYAAFVYYQILSFPVAFILMIAITAFTVYSSIQYNRQEIAILGMTGAYGIPFLISANADNFQLFFAYILFINLGIVFLSFKKEWKTMVLLAMLISWVLFIGWGLSRYDAKSEMTAFLIMTAFYFVFVISSLSFSLYKKSPLTAKEVQHFFINNCLFFIAAFVIYTHNSFESGSVIFGLGFLFFILQAILFFFFLPAEESLVKYLVALSILCLVAYVALQWEGITITMAWLGIAIALFIAGIWSKMTWLRMMAILLTCITLIKLALIDHGSFSTVEKVISYVCIGALLLVLSFFYQKYNKAENQ